jgi:hypothetical protein
MCLGVRGGCAYVRRKVSASTGLHEREAPVADEGHQIALRPYLRWLAPAGALIVALTLSALLGSSMQAFLTNVTRSAAVTLLFCVARASVHMGHTWRMFARHDSIRADIAAGGGLAQRLSL